MGRYMMGAVKDKQSPPTLEPQPVIQLHTQTWLWVSAKHARDGADLLGCGHALGESCLGLYQPPRRATYVACRERHRSRLAIRIGNRNTCVYCLGVLGGGHGHREDLLSRRSRRLGSRGKAGRSRFVSSSRGSIPVKLHRQQRHPGCQFLTVEIGVDQEPMDKVSLLDILYNHIEHGQAGISGSTGPQGPWWSTPATIRSIKLMRRHTSPRAPTKVDRVVA